MKYIYFLISLLLFLSPLQCFSQEQSNHHCYGILTGLGSTPNVFKYKTVTIGLVSYYQVGSHMFILCGIGSFELIWDGPSPDENVKDFSLLYGRYFKNKDLLFSASAGIGVVQGIKRGKWLGEPGIDSSEHECLSFTALGFPIDAQFFVISKHLGWGCHLFGNFNR